MRMSELLNAATNKTKHMGHLVVGALTAARTGLAIKLSDLAALRRRMGCLAAPFTVQVQALMFAERQRYLDLAAWQLQEEEQLAAAAQEQPEQPGAARGRRGQPALPPPGPRRHKSAHEGKHSADTAGSIQMAGLPLPQTATSSPTSSRACADSCRRRRTGTTTTTTTSTSGGSH
jgi:hypothetical protein